MFSKHFSTLRGPNRVLTPLKRASKTRPGKVRSTYQNLRLGSIKFRGEMEHPKTGDHPVNVPPSVEHRTKTRAELVALCKARGIRGYSGKPIVELVRRSTDTIVNVTIRHAIIILWSRLTHIIIILWSRLTHRILILRSRLTHRHYHHLVVSTTQ